MKSIAQILTIAIFTSALLCMGATAIAQTSYYGNKYQIIAEFNTTKFIISKGEVISKILKIVNTGNQELRFSLDLTFPNEWRTLNPREREYDLPPGDSIFVPVRIVPLGKIKGNTSYLIYAYIINGDAVPIASAYFLASRKKIVNWELNVDTGEKLYFKNGERELDFSLNVMNVGNEETDLILDIRNQRKDRLLLTDTNDRVIKEPATFSIKEQEDRSFYYKIKSTNSIRNYKRVDIENFRPDRGAEYQKYSLFATTKESALTGKGEMIKAKKIDFVRLPNYEKANLYRRASIPLILDANLSNLSGQSQPILTVNMRGSTTLKNNALMIYNTFNSFGSYIGSTRFLTNGSYYLGYFDKRLNVSTSSGPGAKTLNAYYKINRRQTISGFYLRGPTYFGKANRTYFSLNYQYHADKFSHGAQLSRVTSQAPGVNTNTAIYTIAYPFMKGHNVGLSLGAANNVSLDTNNAFNRTGVQVGVNYGGQYLKNTLTSSLSATVFSKNYSAYGNANSLGLNHMSRYKLSQEWVITLSNRYVDNRNQPLVLIMPSTKYTLLTNQATFSRRLGDQSLTSELFYNVSNVDTVLNHSRGLGFGWSRYTLENNQLVALNIRGGYNRVISEPDPQGVFFSQFFAIFKYRVWSGNVRYNYGSAAPLSLDINGGQFPQTLAASVSNQYHFANPHFLMEQILTYSYYNVFDRTSLGYTPDLYYFTNSGWRLKLTLGYFVSSSGAQNRYIAASNTGEDGEPKRKISSNFYLNLGVRKEFGIPIPWAKTIYPTVRFLAFIDQNGNGKKDPNEIPLENVVVRFGKWELLTDLDGAARIENVMADSAYTFLAFSLVDLKGYFPKTENELFLLKDSLLLIPFVKGIKVYGNVYVDREKLAPGALENLDLGRIMIHASDHGLEPTNTLTNSDGSFQFYLPYGKYTISVDDRILGENFRILQNDVEVDLDEMSDGMFISFYIVERRRKVNIKKFNGNGDVIEGTERTVQPEEPGRENIPGGSGDGSVNPGGTGTQPAGDTSGTGNRAEPTPGTGGLPKTRDELDVSLRNPAENLPIFLENRSITWSETEYYIVVSAHSQQEAALNYANSLEKQDNTLVVRSKDNLQYLVVYAYRTEQEARDDLESRQSIAPAAWITKKE